MGKRSFYINASVCFECLKHEMETLDLAAVVRDVAKSPYQCAGLKQRMKEPYEKGVATRSAPSLALIP